jgi:hypothetical protein
VLFSRSNFGSEAIGAVIGQQNCGMMNKNTTAWCYGAVFASTFAIVVTSLAIGVWRGLQIWLALMIFFGFWVGFFITGIWVVRYRSEELNKKFPISVTDYRRRKKEFYEWLRRSQERR